jgi:hypothetical protein
VSEPEIVLIKTGDINPEAEVVIQEEGMMIENVEEVLTETGKVQEDNTLVSAQVKIGDR